MIITRVLSGLFGAGVNFRNRLYDLGNLQTHELRGPVISVGNISVGGSGKTPFVIMLGEMLKQRGIQFDILSRGYRRATKGVRFVDPDGTAREYGDEPLLMARRLEVPVVVCENRYVAGHEAEKNWGPRLHLLDDAFQHRQLVRQFDIVLLTPDDFRDVLLPSGRLREPTSSLSRADAVVLTGEPPAESHVQSQNVWRVTRTLQVDNRPTKPVGFCAIGRPRNFFDLLRKTGINPVAEVLFRDHHRYTQTDITRLLRAAESSHADGFITTEKDAINLGELMSRLSPITVATLEMSFENANAALNTIFTTLKERGKPVHERIPLA